MKKSTKVWNKLAYIGTSVSAALVLAMFVLVPIAGLIGIVKLILMMLGVN